MRLDRGQPVNPVSGTVVDDVITLPERYDFYLVRACSLALALALALAQFCSQRHVLKGLLSLALLLLLSRSLLLALALSRPVLQPEAGS
jgi:hypothetical protein